jgi:hypothetical protein
MNLFLKKTIEIENIKIPIFFFLIICHPIPDAWIYSIVCVSLAASFSLSLSRAHGIILKANWIVVDAINAPRSLYALGTLSLLPAIEKISFGLSSFLFSLSVVLFRSHLVSTSFFDCQRRRRRRGGRSNIGRPLFDVGFDDRMMFDLI